MINVTEDFWDQVSSTNGGYGKFSKIRDSKCEQSTPLVKLRRRWKNKNIKMDLK